MKVKQRIGVDIWPLVKLNGGVGYYIFHLLDELIKQNPHHQFFLYVGMHSRNLSHFEAYPNVTLRISGLFSFKYAFWRNSTLPFLLRKDKIDLLWENVFIIPFLKPRKMKTILTIFDFVAYLFPETIELTSVLYQRWIAGSCIKKADYLVTICEATGQRLKHKFGRSADQVVLPPSKPEVFYRERSAQRSFLEKHGLEYNGYLVSVSTWEPRKNFALLIDLYCKAIEKSGLERVMPLVVVGGGGWKNRKIRQAFQKAAAKYPSHFKIAGYVSDTDLAFFLSGARTYISLSLYEGYGMPLAEARRCRTPVISLDVPEMREAAEGDGIFLKLEELEEKLSFYMMKAEKSEGEKPQAALSYPSNAHEAAKISFLINQITCADS